MFNKLLLTLTFISSVFGLQCYTKNYVMNSKSLFWYKNNVYDITGYEHPSGKSDLLKTVGTDLDIFFQMSKYDFHIDKKRVKKDLESMLVGELKDSCSQTTNNPDTTNDPDTTNGPLQNFTTSVFIEPTTNDKLVSNSNSLQYNFLLLITFILVLYMCN